MTDEDLERLLAAGFPMIDAEHTTVALMPSELHYCTKAYSPDDLQRRFQQIATKRGLPKLPPGFRWAASNFVLCIFKT